MGHNRTGGRVTSGCGSSDQPTTLPPDQDSALVEVGGKRIRDQYCKVYLFHVSIVLFCTSDNNTCTRTCIVNKCM